MPHSLKHAFAAALAIVMVPLAATFHADAAPNVSHFSLANGLDVVVIPDHRTPVVTHMLWYRVGAADETPGKTGLAHFLEHLMFKGTEKNPQGLFSQTVSNIGGQENAFTSSDYTGYFQRTAREHLKMLMEFEADRMTGLVLTDLNHPYQRPIIGWRQEIEKLTRDDALAFYKRFYTPNNAILIVAGDVTAEQVKGLADETYGKVARVTEIAPRQRPQEPAQVASRTVTLADPRVTQPSVQRYYLVPSYTTAKPGEGEALEILSHILGRGANSRLYDTLVVEKGIAVNASAGYSGSALDDTRLFFSGTPKPGTTLAQLEDAIDAVIAEVVQNGVTADELARAKTRLVADAVYANDNQGTLARWYGAALTTGGSIEQVQGWTDRLKAVTAEQVRDAAKRWLDKRRSVTGYLVKDSQTVEKRP